MEKTTYRLPNTQHKASQSFDKDKNVFVKNGEEINIYDYIQENKTDTSIYEVLEKYGCIDKIELNREELYVDFEEMQDMRDLAEKDKKATELWEKLPFDVRNSFNNDRYNFMQNGMSWLENFKKNLNPKMEKQNEVKNNEQKQQ